MSALRNRWKHWYRRTAVSIAPRAYWRARFALRGFEEPELRLLPMLCRPDSTVVDVGANFGMYTYWLESLSQRCVAFEPIPGLARALARGFGKRIELHNVALSDHAGTTQIVVPHVSPGLSTIEPSNPVRAQTERAERYTVKMQRLDDFALSNVSFIKIDVEGHEEAVLRGATRLLAVERPSVLLELEERHNPGCIERIKSALHEFGLPGVAFYAGQVLALDTFDAIENQRTVSEGDYARNFLFARPETLAALIASAPSI